MAERDKCPRCSSDNVGQIEKDSATGVYTGTRYPVPYRRYVCNECDLIFEQMDRDRR
jgi:DNA-directed RNA polymerase subunit RPC12/RpoP